MARSPLILAYDAECGICCRMTDWLRARDREGLLVFFPLQGKELVMFAPELAGRDLHGEIHGLDERSRQIWSGGALLPQVLSRLPRWRLVAWVLKIPLFREISLWIWRRRSERRFRRLGRQPFQDRF